MDGTRPARLKGMKQELVHVDQTVEAFDKTLALLKAECLVA